jgi:hypothetical protein
MEMNSMAEATQDPDPEEFDTISGVDPSESNAYYYDEDGELQVAPKLLANSPTPYQWFSDDDAEESPSFLERVSVLARTLYHGRPPE